MKAIRIISLVSFIFAALGCTTVPEKPEGKAVLSSQVQEAVVVFKAKDPSIERFFKDSYGYAVFPKIFKLGFFAGGASGRGEVYEHGKMVGYSRLEQATLGFSFGGEFFREIVFFREKYDMERFEAEEYTLAAQATGVAITEGAAAKADYQYGMAVFVAADKGLMLDVSLGGQKFNFIPANPDY